MMWLCLLLLTAWYLPEMLPFPTTTWNDFLFTWSSFLDCPWFVNDLILNVLQPQSPPEAAKGFAPYKDGALKCLKCHWDDFMERPVNWLRHLGLCSQWMWPTARWVCSPSLCWTHSSPFPRVPLRYPLTNGCPFSLNLLWHTIRQPKLQNRQQGDRGQRI